MIKNIDSKMTTNSQLSTTEPKLSKQLESQKWKSYGGKSAGTGKERMGEKVQGISSINGRYKIDRGS